MRSYLAQHSSSRLTLLASGTLAVILSGCGSSGGLGPIGTIGPGGNTGQVRFVNGSPDAGPVQVFIDNQQQFCAGGTSGTACSIGYGSVTGYAVNLSAGNHAIVLRDQNGNQISLPSGTVGVNSGFKYTIALVGETHPSSLGTPLNAITIQEQPFNTPGGGAALNFNNASPAETKAAGGSVQFGYTLNGGTGNSAPTPVGSAIGVGAETNPSVGGLPSTALNTPLTLYAASPTSGITTTPGTLDAADCASNALPCTGNRQNLSLYLIDGPAASTTPGTGPFPNGASATSVGVFVGAFDPNG